MDGVYPDWLIEERATQVAEPRFNQQKKKPREPRSQKLKSEERTMQITEPKGPLTQEISKCDVRRGKKFGGGVEFWSEVLGAGQFGCVQLCWLVGVFESGESI